MIESMKELGPELAIDRYQALHPSMARREVASMVRRYREVCRQRQPSQVHVLQWSKPGTVWAVDHSHVPAVAKDRKVAISCRDLASHKQLLWQHCSEEAKTTVESLRASFDDHGAPLVFKADNGPAFRSERFERLLDEYGVELLPSPPHCPEYNGSCEAANQSMKNRTAVIAARLDRPEDWSAWDLALACDQINHTARPWGVTGPTPLERWGGRGVIDDAERRVFRESCEHLRGIVTEERELSAEQLEKEFVRRAVQRAAVSRALVESGLLFVRRRVIRPLIQTNRSVSVS